MALPALISIVMPLLIGTFNAVLSLIDLGVTLTADSALITLWYSNVKTLPALSIAQTAVLCALPLLILKLLFVSIPGAFKGKPGALAGCAALVMVPTSIYCTTNFEKLLEPARSSMVLSEDVLVQVVQFQVIDLVANVCMILAAITEYATLVKAATAEEKPKKA